MKDKIINVLYDNHGFPLGLSEKIADEILQMLREAEKFRASEPYFYIINAKRFLDDKQCSIVAHALLGTKDLECLSACEKIK